MGRLGKLGPGLIFAGAAVGVSHFVQSTRAGADWGLGLLLVVVLANVAKYPAFSFGPRYAAVTGTSLVEGYRRQGTWALVAYALLTVGTMFTVQAAVTLLTAGLVAASLGNFEITFATAVALTVGCGLIVGIGKYKWLDRTMKAVVALLTLQTVLATILVIGRVPWSTFAIIPHGLLDDPKGMFFVAALVGWMPSAIDISVWHSLWTLARGRVSGEKPTVRDALFDFDVGYVGTALLALCFVILGAGVIHSANPRPVLAPETGKFAVQILSLYTEVLGNWSRPLIAGCAIMVMFSTTLTVVDGFPRALAALALRFRGPEEAWSESEETSRGVYWSAVIALAVGALSIVRWFKRDLGALVDLATTLSFLTAPLLALLNHRAMLAEPVAIDDRPGRGMVWYSAISIVALVAVAGLWVRFRFL